MVDMTSTSMLLLVGVVCMCMLTSAADEKALYFRNDVLEPAALEAELGEVARQVRQTQSQAQTDLTVRTILEWLQGRSAQTGRKARDQTAAAQQPARQYLPADEGDREGRPRPFQPNPSATAPPPAPPSSSGPSGYPYQPSPQPPFPQPSPSPSPSPSPTPTPAPTLPPYGTADDAPLGSDDNVGGSDFPDVTTGGGGAVSTGDVGGTGSVGGGGDNLPAGGEHPPHIHSIDVQCAKDQMTIDIEFDRPFNGVIYSKGFYRQEACRYVNENSGQTRYSITVRLDSCGTQFVDQFAEGGQAYLENVLVLQNEPGIQEVWDTVRRVRCLWEGNIKKALLVDLSVDMLNQETVTFSGDTAVARLDIQMGRGPFAPQANGLVKIGETMTLVVSVEGDADFDVGVRDCVARDASGANLVRLTDERGCVLRPKLMGAFQKTRASGGAPGGVIAYAFFQAFKFPDVMDLTLECNVELCKTDCQTCPESQSPDPQLRRRRRRRDLWAAAGLDLLEAADNASLADPVRVFRSFRVVSPDDLQEDASAQRAATVINLGAPAAAGGVCMSMPGLLLTAALLVLLLLCAAAAGACLWLRVPHSPSRATAPLGALPSYHHAAAAPPYAAHVTGLPAGKA